MVRTRHRAHACARRRRLHRSPARAPPPITGVPSEASVGTDAPVRNVRVTKGGMVILAVLAAAIVVSLVTTGGPRFLAVGVIALIVLMLVGEGMSGSFAPINSEWARKGEVLGRY